MLCFSHSWDWKKKDSELGRGRVLYTPFNVSFTNSKEALTQIYCNFTFFKTSVLIWTHSFAKKKVKEIWLIKGLKSNLFIKQYNQCFSVIILKKIFKCIYLCVRACMHHSWHTCGTRGQLAEVHAPLQRVRPRGWLSLPVLKKTVHSLSHLANQKYNISNALWMILRKLAHNIGGHISCKLWKITAKPQ